MIASNLFTTCFDLLTDLYSGTRSLSAGTCTWSMEELLTTGKESKKSTLSSRIVSVAQLTVVPQGRSPSIWERDLTGKLRQIVSTVEKSGKVSFFHPPQLETHNSDIVRQAPRAPFLDLI